MLAGTALVQAINGVRETDPKKRVVITGMGVASVFGNDVEQFYNRHGAADPALASCGPALISTGFYPVTRLHFTCCHADD